MTSEALSVSSPSIAVSGLASPRERPQKRPHEFFNAANCSGISTFRALPSLPWAQGVARSNPVAQINRINNLRPPKSERKESNTQRLEAFLAGPLEWTLFDDEDAREAGTVRAELEVAGKPIDAYDVLIAGQARRRDATLVTSNVSEFDRVAGLKWEDWATARR